MPALPQSGLNKISKIDHCDNANFHYNGSVAIVKKGRRKMRSRLKKILLPALFMALTFAATVVVKIPSPTGGYVNLGDGIILLAAFLLGPLYGSVAGGLGAALADILLGYTAYAPATLIIKALVALIAALTLKALKKALPLPAALLLAGIAGELFMVAGYFAYTGFVLGFGLGALASVPGDCVQAAIGVLASSLLYSRLVKIPHIRDFLGKDEKNGK
jgi:uncharacterized membrane protein